MYQRHNIGKIGEDVACNYLIKNKYKIIQRNFRCKTGEIDIIAKDDSELIFIEVKTRTNRKYGEPLEAINIRKKRHIYKTANYYLYINNIEDNFIRFDVIEVYIKEKRFYIHHLKQVIV